MNILAKPGRHECLSQLSRREREVFFAIATAEIPCDTAARLGLSIKSVSTYRDRMLRTLSLTNNSQVAVFAMYHGLVDVDMGAPAVSCRRLAA